MQTLNYWKQFEETGKIEDYLKYRSNPFQEGLPAQESAPASKGENPYAGVYMGNGNHTKAGACRGI